METGEKKWGCEIERADNGFIVHHWSYLTDNTWRKDCTVFEDSSKGNVRSFADMVCWLMDVFAVYECSVKFFDNDGKEIDIDG